MRLLMLTPISISRVFSMFCCTLVAGFLCCHPPTEKPTTTHRLTMVETSGIIAPQEKIIPPLRVPIDTNKLRRIIAGNPGVTAVKKNTIIPGKPLVIQASKPIIT
ncbi:MAG TPA: hypothetical protein VJ508_09030, partial [Saprospiraceae bacterium]|nr:hypothetical protein [Saprospiraceae bacterium]